jgi:anti-anti-sigma factor
MSSRPLNSGLEIEHVGGVGVVRFRRRHVLTGEAVEALGGRLLSLADDPAHRRLVVNLGDVERLSTALLGKLAALQRRLREGGGGVAVCGVSPELHAVLRALRLDRHLDVCGSEEDALQRVL